MENNCRNATARRREEIAFMYLYEERNLEEIIEDSGYSRRTIERDIQYINENRELYSLY